MTLANNNENLKYKNVWCEVSEVWSDMSEYGN